MSYLPPIEGNPDGCWIISYLSLKLADGTYILKPQKPVFRASARVTSKLTHVSEKTLVRLAESGFISCALSTPGCRLYYPAEVEEFLQKTIADPDFWTPARRKQYAMARLKKSPPAEGTP